MIGKLFYKLGILLEFNRIKERRLRFAHRKQIAVSDIYNQFYSKIINDKERFVFLWTKIGEILKIDPRLLRPDDRFDGILAPVKGSEINDELEDIDDFFSDVVSSSGHDYFACEIKTIDDLIKLCFTTGDMNPQANQ